MNKKKTTTVFAIKELYTISDIVAYTQGTLSRQQVKQLATMADVKFLRSGTSIYIPIDEFRLKMPTLWDSLMSARDVRLDCND